MNNYLPCVLALLAALLVSGCGSFKPDASGKGKNSRWRAPQTGTNIPRNVAGQTSKRAKADRAKDKKKRADAKAKRTRPKPKARETDDDVIIRGGFR